MPGERCAEHADDGAGTAAHRSNDGFIDERAARRGNRARDNGTNIAFLGANDGYWEIRYQDGERTLYRHVVAQEPDGEPGTGLFRALPTPRTSATSQPATSKRCAYRSSTGGRSTIAIGSARRPSAW